MSDAIIRSERLDNGLELVFHDRSNRYFGDYHQVKVVVTCRVPISDELAGDRLNTDQIGQARRIFGDHVEYRHLLRQMAVPGADVEAVRLELVRSFLETAATYMQGDDFAARYVSRRLAEHRQRSRLHLVGHD